MTIDTSKEAVERLARMCGAEASYKTHIGTLMAQASDMLVNLAAECDAQTARAEAAAEVARLKNELAKQMLADEMLRGLYDDEAADVARLTAELTALRAGQDALVAAAYEAVTQWHIARIAEMNAQIAENNEYMALHGLSHSDGNAYCRDSILNSRIAVKAIRALTTADATAAMNAKLRAERNKVRRAVAALPPYDGDGEPAGQFDHHIFVRRSAILAMIEPEGK